MVGGNLLVLDTAAVDVDESEFDDEIGGRSS
jgi:hypothetical protein